MSEITIPYNFAPREYQDDFLRDNHRFKIAVWHRRGGKSKTVLNGQIEKALMYPGVYYYFLPTYRQAKSVVWDALIKEHLPMDKRVVSKVNASELAVYFTNGSILRFAGTDDPDLHRGINPIDVVFDEYSEMDQTIWEAVIQPVLAENHGTATFIFCVTGDTLVLTDNGFKYIGNSEKKIKYVDNNDNLFGLGGFHKATDFYSGGKCPIIKIVTNAGYELKCTPEHRVWNGEKWIFSKDLKVGNNLSIQRNQQIFGNNIDFSDWRFFGSRKLKKEFILVINEDLFYLLGLILAEGCHDKNCVTVTNFDENIINFLKNNDFIDYGGGHFKRSSQAFSDFVSWFGIKHGAKNKTIPEKVFSLPKKYQAAFLSGYFDGDGSADKKGRVTCVSSSEKLIKELQILLLNYGICSYKTKVITPPTKKVKVFSVGNRLEIGGYNAYLFFNQIGFRLKRKQDRLSYLSGKSLEYWNDFAKVDVKKTKEILKINKKLGGFHNFNLTYNTIKKLNINDEYLKKILDDNYYYDKVKTIEYDEDYVYDYVIPETHSFFSNGFISHNTPKGKNHSWKLVQEARNNPDRWLVSIKTVDDTKGIDDDELERVKVSTPQALFNQEYFCEFSENAGSFFRRVKENTYNADGTPERGHLYQIGIDLAKYNDWTVLTPFDLNTFKVKRLERFNQVDWPLQEAKITAYAAKYYDAQLMMDRTGVGDSVIDHLENQGLNIGEEGRFVFNQKSKRDLLSHLAILLENDRIKIPDDEGLIAELESMQCELTDKGALKIVTPRGMTDDRVMSLALAVWNCPVEPLGIKNLNIMPSEAQVSQNTTSLYDAI